NLIRELYCFFFKFFAVLHFFISLSGFFIFILPDFWVFVDCSFSITLHGTSTIVNLVRAPLISEAENAFTLGISKRSEPVIDGGGG
ncbi:MAG: hypothetical protein J6I46_11785, partial [Ruminococcus sp.]|nr:hypothetical protein [Ruminococcus sp.]